MSPQMKKGFLEYCILAILKKGDSYGYQIIKDVDAVIAMPESTLYPILKRLEKQEKVTSYPQEAEGRIRKYYQLTDLGEQDLREFLADREEVAQIYEFVKGALENG